MEEASKCNMCSIEIEEGEDYEFADKDWCEDCYYDHTFYCESCTDRFYTVGAVSLSNGDLVCSSCYEEHYTCCLICERDLVDTEAYSSGGSPYCEDCYYNLEEDDDDNYIKTYSYKPTAIFFGTGNLYFGVELEVDRGEKSDKSISEILDIANNDNEHVYLKSDGSLTNGFEIVTHPMTYEYHLEDMSWKEILNKLVSLGYRSHEISTCGYHIHVSRKRLGTTVEEQEESIANLVSFVENNWSKIVRFSRRTEMALNKWAARCVNTGNRDITLKYVKDGDTRRYTCINLLNPNTVEFRIFRGTLLYTTFIATLQFVHELCVKITKVSVEEIEHFTWEDFLNTLDESKVPELIEYLCKRGLWTIPMQQKEAL